MKKKRLSLDKKLVLNKKTVAALNAGQVMGGATQDVSGCVACNTVPHTFCQCPSQICSQICPTNTGNDFCVQHTAGALTCVGCPPPLTNAQSCWQDGQTRCI